MANNKKDATTVLDVIKSHFGIDRMAESRAERRSALAQEQREQRQVNNGNVVAIQEEQTPIQVFARIADRIQLPNMFLHRYGSRHLIIMERYTEYS